MFLRYKSEKKNKIHYKIKFNESDTQAKTLASGNIKINEANNSLQKMLKQADSDLETEKHLHKTLKENFLQSNILKSQYNSQKSLVTRYKNKTTKLQRELKAVCSELKKAGILYKGEDVVKQEDGEQKTMHVFKDIVPTPDLQTPVQNITDKKLCNCVKPNPTPLHDYCKGCGNPFK
jgi:hypothetical protein